MYIGPGRILVIAREGILSLITLIIIHLLLTILKLVIYGILSLPIFILLFLFFKENIVFVITAYSLFVVGLFIGRRAFIGFDL